MGLSEHGYMALSLGLGVPLVSFFFLFAMYRAYVERERNRTVEAFLTARGRASAWRVGWAFFSAGMGAWVITSPPSYTPYAGMIGCVMYALSAGAPLLLIAYLGGHVQSALPRVVSLTDFAGWRFGSIGRVWVALFVCLNVGIAMLAEYTTIGALFGTFLGVSPTIMIVIVGVLTMGYTSFGGLLISIVTDQIQGVAAAVLLLFIAIYVAVTFRFSLPHPMPCDPNDAMGFCISGESETGWGSIFSMPASLATATVFSEAMWQRVWAAESRRALRRGAWFGFLGIFLGVFMTGLVGLLAAWAGQIGPSTDSNLYLFAAFPNAIDPATNRLSSWIGIVVLLCAAIMNESAIDSMQNGLVAAISGAALKGRPLWVTRLLVVAINVPVMVVATRGYTIIQLFLIANIACATGALPVFAGLWRRLDPYYGGGGLVFSTLLAIAGTSVFGVHKDWDDALSRSENIAQGMRYAWMENNYNWLVFLVCICCSAGGVLISIACNAALKHLFHAHPAIPGLASPATHPHLFPPTPHEGEFDPSLDDPTLRLRDALSDRKGLESPLESPGESPRESPGESPRESASKSARERDASQGEGAEPRSRTGNARLGERRERAGNATGGTQDMEMKEGDEENEKEGAKRAIADRVSPSNLSAAAVGKLGSSSASPADSSHLEGHVVSSALHYADGPALEQGRGHKRDSAKAALSAPSCCSSSFALPASGDEETSPELVALTTRIPGGDI